MIDFLFYMLIGCFLFLVFAGFEIFIRFLLRRLKKYD